MFLNSFTCESLKEKGISLNSVVNTIREKINQNTATLKYFNERLESADYFEEHIENYNAQYGVKSKSIYVVNENFPKLTIGNLPNGVYNTSYYIENSAIEDFKVEYVTIINELKNE